uniref:Phospholipid phosphatase 2 n=1 Tax=Spermophilus dauricus TaxID=99837 RepID=A0A8C9P645_SPEDA
MCGQWTAELGGRALRGPPVAQGESGLWWCRVPTGGLWRGPGSVHGRAPRPSLASPASLPFAILTLVNTPYKRGFYCGDDSIRYPYRPDTITHGLMAGVTITTTVILVSAGEAYLVYTDRLYSRSDFNNYVAALYKVLGTFLFGAAVSQSLTDLAKYMIGRLRPNFLAVCDPDWSRVNCSVYVQLERVCRGSPANVTEARLSFYSGHSSFGMYCMLFLAVSFSAPLCRWICPWGSGSLSPCPGPRAPSGRTGWACWLVPAPVAGAPCAPVRYVSDFFKARPLRPCLEEAVERKPSLSLTLTDPDRPQVPS